MQSNHQYFVKTKNGMLQLSKGAYLTILKRQNNQVKTFKKTKKIHHYYENLQTVKKFYCNLKNQNQSGRQNQSMNLVKELSFLESKGLKNEVNALKIFQDRKIFSMRSIPFIEIQCDNDLSSDWSQVGRGVQNMKQSFSMAILNSMKFDIEYDI